MADIRTLFCPNCGASVRRGDLECEFCGSALYAGHAAEVTAPALAEAQKIIPLMQAHIKQNPDDGNAYYELGLACFTLKLNVQAEEAFEQAQRLSPGDARVHYFSGLSILRSAEPEILSVQEFRINQMKKQFETALSIDPKLAEAGVYGTFADALLARNHEDYAAALEPLRRVVEALPKFTMAWKVLAACCFQVTDFEGATQAGIRGLQLEPGDGDLAFLVGAAYARMRQTDETEAWARRVATLRGHPSDWPAIAREFKGQLE